MLPPGPYLPVHTLFSTPPTITEYRQRREAREEAEGIIPERKRLEVEQLKAIADYDVEISDLQKERHGIL